MCQYIYMLGFPTSSHASEGSTFNHFPTRNAAYRSEILPPCARIRRARNAPTSHRVNPERRIQKRNTAAFCAHHARRVRREHIAPARMPHNGSPESIPHQPECCIQKRSNDVCSTPTPRVRNAPRTHLISPKCQAGIPYRVNVSAREVPHKGATFGRFPSFGSLTTACSTTPLARPLTWARL
jgi:hypothetical protein